MNFPLPEHQTPETKKIKTLKLGKHVKVLVEVQVACFAFSPE